MTGIMGYLLLGVLALWVYTIIGLVRTTDASTKEVLKDFLHPIIFVLTWPLDTVWCLYHMFKYSDEFGKNVKNYMNKHL